MFVLISLFNKITINSETLKMTATAVNGPLLVLTAWVPGAMGACAFWAGRGERDHEATELGLHRWGAPGDVTKMPC